MNRRIIASLAGVVLAIVCLSACTPDTQSNDGRPSVPPVTSEPQDTPPVIENAIIFVTDPVDTTSFNNPPGYNWGVVPSTGVADVTVILTEHDWIDFAGQLGIDPTVDPDRVQMGFDTLSSLVDYEAIVQDVHEYFQRYGEDIDLTTLDTSYSLRVFGQ